MGDIGTHAENLAEYLTGLQIKELAADLTAFVDGRLLDDDGNVLLRFEGGAKGILHASQISVGEENSLSIRIYGEKGGLEWHQMEPNTLLVHRLDQPTQIYRTGNGYLGEGATAHSRIPAGHPEGYLEAFANIYRNFAADIASELSGEPAPSYAKDYPTIKDGVRGMAYIEAVVKSSQNNASWTELELSYGIRPAIYSMSLAQTTVQVYFLRDALETDFKSTIPKRGAISFPKVG